MITNKILNYIGYRFIDAGAVFDNRHKWPRESAKAYKRDDPFQMKRVTYPLNENSLVVDVGGYTGDWAARMYCMYSCFVDVYEPDPGLAAQARENFAKNKKVVICEFGLGNEDATVDFYGGHQGASVFQNDMGDKKKVYIRKVSDVFGKKYTRIDLLKINIEGSEYALLDDLLRNFDMRNITTLQIQFHKNVKGYAEKREAIRNLLSKTHRMTWDYDYIFENWEVIP